MFIAILSARPGYVGI